jgi:hypothetical protein
LPTDSIGSFFARYKDVGRITDKMHSLRVRPGNMLTESPGRQDAYVSGSSFITNSACLLLYDHLPHFRLFLYPKAALLIFLLW